MTGNEPVLYQPGERWIHTVIGIHEDGEEVCFYSGELISQMMADNPRLKKMSYDQASDLIDKEYDKLLTPFKRTTEEHWEDMLGCLPPEKWEMVLGVSIFRMCEYYAENITSHYAKINHGGKDYYFTAHRRTTCKYTDIAEEIYNLVKEI